MTQTPDQAVETLMRQAYEQLTEGQFEEAVDTFSAALAVGPQEAKVLRGRGLAYLQLKRWALAAADFEAARDLAPEDPDNWVDWGISLAMDNRVYPAIEVFDTLLTRQPDCARGHLELGLLHLRLGAIPRGRQQLQKALACHPTLDQRRLIESVLREQDTFDRKRFYRPDFEALRKERQRRASVSFAQRVQAFFKRLRGVSPRARGRVGRQGDEAP